MRIESLGLRTLMIIIILIFSQDKVVSSFSAQSEEEQEGLIGIFYDHSNFTRPVSIWKALSLNSSELDWPEHKDFSAQWQGNIEAPYSGRIVFEAEADNTIRIEINGKSLIPSEDKTSPGRAAIEMKAGDRYPIKIKYQQISGPSHMNLSWSWEGKEKAPIPGNMLHYASSDKSEIQNLFRKDADQLAQTLSFDIASILRIDSMEDVAKKRAELGKLLFGEAGIPVYQDVDAVEENIRDDDFNNLTGLQAIKKLTINMDFGLNSIVYHFIPSKPGNIAVIYHQGHNGKFSLGNSTINGLLAKGYHVLGMSMPLKGMNSQPIVDMPAFGKMNMNSHGRMAFLEPEQGHPVKYFLEPVFRVINYLQKQGFKAIHMTGISGGGWTTTLCAAMDSRIQYSYPVAGSLPIYLRLIDPKDGSWGDYEQVVPELYRIANYLELYVMGASGDGRRQIQFLNEFDSCCFSGTGYTTYKDIVIQKVIDLGSGSFDVFLDSSHEEHKISPLVLEQLLKDLEN